MIGEISLFASSHIPSGWLPCKGQWVSVSEYPELYRIIGHRYGGSLGSFRLPNLYDGPVENVQAYLREYEEYADRAATNYRVDPRVYTEIRRDKSLIWMIQAKPSVYEWVTAHSTSLEIIEWYNGLWSGSWMSASTWVGDYPERYSGPRVMARRNHSRSLEIIEDYNGIWSGSWMSASTWIGGYPGVYTGSTVMEKKNYSASLEIDDAWLARSSGAFEIHSAALDIHSAALDVHSASVDSKSGSWDINAGWDGDNSASVLWSASHAWEWITAQSSSFNTMWSSHHSHGNKDILDGISGDKTSSWDNAVAKINASESLWGIVAASESVWSETYRIVSSSPLWPTGS